MDSNTLPHRQQTNLVADKLVRQRSNLFAGMFYSHHHHRLASHPPPSLLTGASRCPPPQHVTAPQDDPEQMEECQRGAKGQTPSGGEPRAKTEGRHVNAARGRNDAGSVYGPKQCERTPETTQHGHPQSNEVRDARPTTSDAPERTTTMCAPADACPTNPPQQHQHHAEQRGYPRNNVQHAATPPNRRTDDNDAHIRRRLPH
ncbi:hypothetical protein DXG01_008594 [Tephrocybe rancida]|nr:hypothetical protein DXG01_008594 [Tephrocybe rancida]